MPSPVYATSAQLETWTGEAAPDNADRLLRHASRLVRAATLTAWYTTDATGLPTDPDVEQAMRDATTAQAQTWIALGIDPTEGAAGASGSTVAASGIGGANVQYAVYAAAADARRAAADALTGEALRILDDAGLLDGTVTAY